MNRLVDVYMKKVSTETDDQDLKDGISGVNSGLDNILDAMDRDTPFLTKPKSSFKAVSKKMTEIENGTKD
ncbi:MAG: hypothetical protein KAS32_11785 [Candidatus Peribacteraceae bacterium]|nr:hypothetical protein [Candidatus Peribacteraceae bacterium]